MQKRQSRNQVLSAECIEPNAAGIDVGATEIYVAVPLDRDQQPVRSFATFTEDLRAMAAWLVQCRITTVAMESTGVYWIPPYEILEAAGLRVCLVNSKHVKHVPGRNRGPRRQVFVAGVEVGRGRLPVVAVSSFGRPAGPLVPSRRGNLRHPLPEPAPLQPCGNRGHARAAHAQGADPAGVPADRSSSVGWS
jgi:hypothetical protein